MFTEGLYFPFIDISDDSIAKTSALYYDKIHTIVPLSYEEPYQTDTTSQLHKAGILTPHFIHKYDKTTEEAFKSFLDVSNSDEFRRCLRATDDEPYLIHNEKFTQRLPDINSENIHEDKISYRLKQDFLDMLNAKHNDGPWVRMNSKLANTYMIALANTIAAKNGFSTFTNNVLFGDMSTRLNYPTQSLGNMRLREYSDALLANITIKEVGISKDTPVDKIIEYRHRHMEEIIDFRNAISELTANIQGESFSSQESFAKYLKGIHRTKISPAMSNLERSLRDLKFQTIIMDISIPSVLSIADFTMGNPWLAPTVIPIASTMWAATRLYTYFSHRRQLLRKIPLSFPVLLKKTITQKPTRFMLAHKKNTRTK